MNKTVIHTIEQFETWFESEWRPIMSFDTETSSLNYLDMELLGFSLCNGTAACYIIGDALICLDSVFDVLELIIMHNAVFDLKVIHKYGIREIGNIFCTLVGMKLLDENRGKNQYGLKTLAHKELGVPESEILTFKEAEKLGVNSDEFYDYAQNDVIWTYQLWELQQPALDAQDLTYLAETVEMPFQRVLADLEINGVLVDKKTLHEFIPKCEDILFELETLMLEELGMVHDVVEEDGEIKLVSPVNFSSSQQLVAVSQDILGLEITERTKQSKKFPKGQPSVDKQTIARLRAKSEFFNLLGRYRKLNTLYKTFLAPCEGFIDKDGRIRSSYRMVRTGRLSSSKPNLTNLPNPKKEKLEFNHRTLFIAGEGNVFVKADWSGQELRVLAEESQDERMIDAFKNNLDLHLLTANSIFDLGLGEKDITQTSKQYATIVNTYKKERHRAKNGVNFPIIYGKTEHTLATDFNITVEEALCWMNEFHNLYPRVKKAIRITELELEEQEYVCTMMGRHRRFPGYKNMNKWEKAAALRQAFNFKIQGGSADIGKLAGIRLREYNARLVLFIHDEWIAECPKECADEIAKMMKNVTQGIVCLSVDMVVNITIAESYGG